MASPEYNIESLVIAILQNSATFSGVSIEHLSEDNDTVEKANRLEVKCDPKTPMVDGRSMSKPAPVWQANVTIEAKGKTTETVWDNWKAAIDTEIGASSYQAEVVAAATACTPPFTMVEIDQPQGGADFQQPDKRRNLTRTLRVVFST